jgi:hypothetical protein
MKKELTSAELVNAYNEFMKLQEVKPALTQKEKMNKIYEEQERMNKIREEYKKNALKE